MLYIVPTPIGNMQDMTFRAVEVLKKVDLILAEDTRQTKKLTRFYGIEKPMWSHHKFNEHKTLENIMLKFREGLNLALVSDGGTPGISDPGFLLVRACVKEYIKVSCLPGATAFLPALVCSGFPSDKFIFEGFLPHKKGRKTRLEFLSQEHRTIILYESPHRLLKTLAQVSEYMGKNRKISISREISKVFEENVRGTCDELIQHFTIHKPKGEFVIVIDGNHE